MDKEIVNKLSDYVENQEEIRQRLIKVIRKMKLPSLSRIAKEMFLSSTTLVRFFRGEKRVEWRALFAIEEWVIAKEKELGINQPNIDTPTV
jgi:hypothetical protein